MRSIWLMCLAFNLTLTSTAGARQHHHEQAENAPTKPAWLPDELPLPLAVHNPRDLEFKRVVEREYLIFNLLAAGKVAYDAGRYADAADQWETLLQMPKLDRDIDQVVRPLVIEARRKAGQTATIAATPPPDPIDEPVQPKPRTKRTTVEVRGTIAGGGAAGPGGAVITLKRADGRTPRPSSRGHYVMRQHGKRFEPHVLAVPVGATVAFRNDDDIFHDVFTPNGFDLGLYKSGLSRNQTFESPGVTPLYCNIHARMSAWIVTVDTPYYAVAEASGRFTIRNVPPGQYVVTVWDEGATKMTTARIAVETGMPPLMLTVGSDRPRVAYPLDKYGQPRQEQLGY